MGPWTVIRASTGSPALQQDPRRLRITCDVKGAPDPRRDDDDLHGLQAIMGAGFVAVETWTLRNGTP
jgi:hypothetical protein